MDIGIAMYVNVYSFGSDTWETVSKSFVHVMYN